MIELIFWGVRGTNPVSGKSFEKIGGHTSCVSVKVNDDPTVVFDAGSGIYNLGKKITAAKETSSYMFISHSHLDHIMGTPFFSPLWDPKCQLNIYSHKNNAENTIKQIIVNAPVFPIKINYSSNVNFHEMPKDGLQVASAKITGLLMNHPGGSMGYRLEAEGKSICYLTDVEHMTLSENDELVEFIRNCDLLIFDSCYTEHEYTTRVGWGHSTHIQSAKIAKLANVKKLALFHQDPNHTDEMSDQIEKEAKEIFPGAFAACEGMKLTF